MNKNIYQNTNAYHSHITEISKDFFNENQETINQSLKDGDSLTEILSDSIYEFSQLQADNEIIYYYNSFKICELFEFDSISDYFQGAESEILMQSDMSQFNSFRDIRQAIAHNICFQLINEEIYERLQKLEKIHEMAIMSFTESN